MNGYTQSNEDMIIKAADELGNIFVKKYENNVRIKKGRPNKKYPRFERLRGYYVLMVGVKRQSLNFLK